MSEIALRVDGLSKQYRIGRREPYRTLRDALAAPFRGIAFGTDLKPEAPSDLFWALKDVSFEIPGGVVLGVIGRNGAGKSTLLKILSRITEPTEGRIEIHGRVGSLLEVGTGFHPELTGRENVLLNGAILGMQRAEVSRRFDEIVAFAEVDRFIDTPVKHYSSGMYMRLAFAVAAHLEPEILVVDEILAVGDLSFQKKCLGKIGQVATEGRTVLFVSHNMAAVNALCGRAVHLDAGRVVNLGPASEVVEAYTRTALQPISERRWPTPAAQGNVAVYPYAVRVIDASGRLSSQFDIAEPIYVEVDYRLVTSCAPINVSISLYAQDDTYVLASPSTSGATPATPVAAPGIYRSRCKIPGHLLNEGTYAVTVFLVKNMGEVVASMERTVRFSTSDTGTDRSHFFGRWGGVVRPKLFWETVELESEQWKSNEDVTSGMTA